MSLLRLGYKGTPTSPLLTLSCSLTWKETGHHAVAAHVAENQGGPLSNSHQRIKDNSLIVCKELNPRSNPLSGNPATLWKGILPQTSPEMTAALPDTFTAAGERP